MAVQTTKTNKPINPRGNDQSPKGYNRAALYSGKALDFDGVNDYVDLDGFTMAGNVATIIFQAKFSNGAYILDINTQRFVVLNNTTNGLSVYNSNAWSYYGHTDRGKVGFYAIVSDGTTQRAYYNGHQLGEDKTIVAIDWDSITEMALGSNNNGTGNFFDGQIAGFKIFNTALTAAQVSDLYNNPEKIVPTGVADSALKLWIPMMEGAGTTAYDGSGGGNHGTISGATWTHGIGSPVAQTAVIDWNKLYDFDGVDDQAYNTSYADTTGTKTYKVHFIAHDVNTESQVFQIYNGVSLKGAGATIDFLGTNNGTLGLRGFINGVSYGIQSWSVEVNTYYELSVTINWDTDTIVSATLNGESPTGVISARINTTNDGLYLGARIDAFYLVGIINYFEVVGVDKWTNASGFKSESGSYDMTITGSPSQILAPQGLTSGRDITGVNLFENVRKQGALNLDGNSWAEVHDNASLDFGTGAFTLEAWARAKYVDTGSSLNAIMTLGGVQNGAGSIGIISSGGIRAITYYNTDGTIATGAETEGDWFHIVGTYDGSIMSIYINGVFKNSHSRTAADITNDLVKMIGRDTTTVRYYNDQIAQPRIYNRALTAEEVERNYNAGKNIYS